MDANLQKNIELWNLADVACYSRFHFHRLYRDLVGETPAETVRRLRMERAAGEIAARASSVIAAANAYGYNSAQSFSRAFKATMGYAPSELALGRADGGIEMPLRFVELALIRTKALRFRGNNGDLCRSIGELATAGVVDGVWRPAHGFFSVLNGEPFPGESSVLECEIGLAGTTAANINRDRGVAVELPAGTYAVLRLRGADSTRAKRFAYAINTLLPRAGYLPKPGPMVRRHLIDPVLRPESLRESDLYIPVSPVA